MILNIGILRKAYFLLNYIKWRLLGLQSNHFVRIFPNVQIPNPQHIHIEKNCTIYSHVIIKTIEILVKNSPDAEGQMQIGDIYIGEHSQIGELSFLNCLSEIKIGKNVLIAPQCYIGDADHIFKDRDIPIRSQGNVSEKVLIEDDVWIGAGVKVLRGVTIGRGSVIAAGTVVTQDIPPYTLAAGIPAKIIRSIRSV